MNLGDSIDKFIDKEGKIFSYRWIKEFEMVENEY